MKGQLEVKLGQDQVRKMNPDKHFLLLGLQNCSRPKHTISLSRNEGGLCKCVFWKEISPPFYRCPRGSRFSISGRVVALVRNVGLHMVTDAVRKGNQPVPEGLLDTMITACAALHDVRNAGSNSKKGCIYIVKPKMHGPEEVSFVWRTFSAVEKFLGLTKGTMKIGIMDEERRTSLNLVECLRVASDRVFFINTGFLDRTGDEIHTCMHGGPVLAKADIKKAPWIAAYEQLNTLTGLQANF